MTREKRALVVDDDDTLRIVVKRQLSKLGYVVDVAATGKAAVDAITANEPYDLVLMDLQMPELDGFEATLEIRKWELARNTTHRAKIVAMTASQEKDRALEAGMNDFLFKPFVFEDVRKLVEKLAS